MGLLLILDYVQTHFDSDIAIATAERIERSCENLAENPGLGHRREDITSDDSIRFWPVGPSLIAYQIREEGIVVLFIERGDRDWKQVLSSKPRGIS